MRFGEAITNRLARLRGEELLVVIKKIVILVIVGSFFHGPLKVVIGAMLGIGWPPLALVVLLAGLLLKLMCHGFDSLSEIKLSWFDLAMGAWLAALVVSMWVTTVQVGNMSGVLNSMGHILSIPLGYFLFRLLIVERYGNEFIGLIVVKLLKLSVVWLVVEFILVNGFSCSASVEEFIAPFLGADRLYDNLGETFVKAAGPIPGSQNGSIIAAMALGMFSRNYLLAHTKEDLKWGLISAVAFLFTFTLTAVLVFFLTQLIYWHNKSDYKLRIYSLISVAACAALGASFLDEILAMKTGTVWEKGELAGYYLASIGDMGVFFSSLVSSPFGVGWAINASDPNVVLIGLDAGAVPFSSEVFLLRMLNYGGLPLVVALMFFFAIAWLAYKNITMLPPSRQPILQTYYVVFSSIIFSALHYPSILAPGFAILFAAVSAQLACCTKIKLGTARSDEFIGRSEI